MLRIKTSKRSAVDNSIIEDRTLEYKLYTGQSTCQKFLKVWRYILENTVEPMELFEEYPACIESLETLTQQLKQGCEQVIKKYPDLTVPENWKNTVFTNEDLNILHDGFVETIKQSLIKKAQVDNEEEDLKLLELLETIKFTIHKIEGKMLYAKNNQTPPYIQSLMYPLFDSDDTCHQPLTKEDAEESYDVTFGQKNCLIIANQVLGRSLEAISFADDYKSLIDTEHGSSYVPKTSIKTGMTMFVTKTQNLQNNEQKNKTVNQQMLDWCEKNNVAELGIDAKDPYNKCGRMIIGEQTNTLDDDYAWFTDEDCIYTIDRLRFDTAIITVEFYKHKNDQWMIETNASQFE